jgi:hypothetical protein
MDASIIWLGKWKRMKPSSGGKARNMHFAKRERRITGTGGKDKTAVMGIMERGGKVRTKVVTDRKKKSLQAEIKKHIRFHRLYKFFDRFCSNIAIVSSATPAAPRLAFTCWYASHTARFAIT